MPLSNKGAHHANARQPLAHDERDAVELRLHTAVIRNACLHDKPEETAHHGHRHDEDEPEPHVDSERSDKRAHGQKRPAHELPYAERDGKLYLVDVVGDARGERRRTKAIEVSMRKRVDVLVQAVADACAHALRRARGHLLAGEGEEDGHGSHREKDSAACEHGLHAVRAHARVDHIGHNDGREQVEHDFDELAERTENKVRAVRATEAFEELEHRPPSVGQWIAQAMIGQAG